MRQGLLFILLLTGQKQPFPFLLEQHGIFLGVFSKGLSCHLVPLVRPLRHQPSLQRKRASALERWSGRQTLALQNQANLEFLTGCMLLVSCCATDAICLLVLYGRSLIGPLTDSQYGVQGQYFKSGQYFGQGRTVNMLNLSNVEN